MSAQHKPITYTVEVDDGDGPFRQTVTLPTPLGNKWNDIQLESAVVCEVGVANKWSRFQVVRYTSYANFTSLIDTFRLEDERRHPEIRPVPFSFDFGCEDKSSFKVPDGVPEESVSDPAWERFAAKAHIPHDKTPHWTLVFSSLEAAERRSKLPLPPLHHSLLQDPDIKRITFVFDRSRLENPDADALHVTSVIMNVLMGDLIMESEDRIKLAEEAAEPARKRPKTGNPC